MKHLILALAIGLASPVAAQTNPAPDTCAQFGEMAHSMMLARQNGVPMSTLMAVTPQVDPALTTLVQSLIAAAYAIPRFSTEEYRQRAATDFRNEVERACYGAMLGAGA